MFYVIAHPKPWVGDPEGNRGNCKILNAMSDRMQTLGVVGRLFPLILSGDKISTIRWREKRISPGPMTYVSDDDANATAVVNVVRCTDMPLDAVAAFLGKADEWPDEVLLAGMREHYPAIKLTEMVQVIEHDPWTAASDHRQVLN